jgi:uncharacterized OsmC-like protein
MKKLSIASAKVHVEMDFWRRGSVLQGTVKTGWNEVRTHFELESDEDEEAVLEIIRLAKAGCFAERLVETAVPLRSTATLNGKDVELPSEES